MLCFVWIVTLGIMKNYFQLEKNIALKNPVERGIWNKS